MTGYDLMTEEQKAEWQDLAERAQHRDTMRFTGLDAVMLARYRILAHNLEIEFHKAEEQDNEL